MTAYMMHDQQTKLKADSPNPDLLKSPQFWHSHMQESSVTSETEIGLCLFLDLESPLFCQQCNVCNIKNPKLIGHCMTTTITMSVSSLKFAAIVADINDPMTPSHLRFSCLIFTVCVDYDVSWYMYKHSFSPQK